MEKIVKQGLLYDFYGELLNDHQRRIYEDIVFEDMSLSEIAEAENITKQGVSDLIRRCDKSLSQYEEKLHLARRFSTIRDLLEDIEDVCSEHMQGSPGLDRVRALTARVLEEL